MSTHNVYFHEEIKLCRVSSYLEHQFTTPTITIITLSIGTDRSLQTV